MRWRPRFTYTNADSEAVDLTLAFPVTLWQYVEDAIGGTAVAGSGLRAGYVVRRDYGLSLTLRFLELEWPAVEALIEAWQGGASVLWYPDTNESEAVSVRLESPAVGDEFEATPDADYPRALTLPIVMRRADGAGWDRDYFLEVA
jgi:hypothetical protein